MFAVLPNVRNSFLFLNRQAPVVTGRAKIGAPWFLHTVVFRRQQPLFRDHPACRTAD